MNNSGTNLTYKVQIALIFLAPVLLLAGLFALGQTIPVPVLGRDYVVRVDLGDSGSGMGLPDIVGSVDEDRPLVVIDAGHGGHDPGASGEGLREKVLTLALARALRDELVEDGGFRVALTRDDDRFLALVERVEIARELGADLFLSIHADSAGELESVRGASVYTLSDEASSEQAERFAVRENQADQVNGVLLARQSNDVNAILVELSQRRTSQQSTQFAELIQREGSGVIRFHPQAQRSAALGVLRAPDVPSVLLESGFISNPNEAEMLASPEGQKRMAGFMVQAIRIFFARNSQEA